jgi:hypothetical protein
MRRLIVFGVTSAFALGACADRRTPPPMAAPPPGPPLAMAAEPATLAGTAFNPECDVPFGSIGEVRPIDNSCGPEGTGSEKSR